jgi:hypothetical protein
LLVGAVGERPLGIQASQIAAIARWAHQQYHAPVVLVSAGVRSSLAALVAAAIEERAIGELELHGSLGSLKESIESNWHYEKAPELFCFGLLERFDVKQLAALVAPRPVKFPAASLRLKRELSGLHDWYACGTIRRTAPSPHRKRATHVVTVPAIRPSVDHLVPVHRK